MLGRNDAIGMQASLVCMCTLTIFCSLDGGNADNVNWHVSFWFFLVSMFCATASVHVILLTMWANTWGHGLALTGPTGSLNRALVLIARERKQVNMWFAFCMVTFVIQTILCVWTMNDEPDFTGWAGASTVIGILFTIGCIIGLKRMKKRFFGWEGLIDSDERASAAGGGGHDSMRSGSSMRSDSSRPGATDLRRIVT